MKPPRGYRKLKVAHVTLVKLKRWPTLKRHLAGVQVRIWSGEWQLYWNPDGCGYTASRADAGVWMFEDALRVSRHAGPEKQIVYERVVP